VVFNGVWQGLVFLCHPLSCAEEMESAELKTLNCGIHFSPSSSTLSYLTLANQLDNCSGSPLVRNVPRISN
jgi:hypothetical protein